MQHNVVPIPRLAHLVVGGPVGGDPQLEAGLLDVGDDLGVLLGHRADEDGLVEHGAVLGPLYPREELVVTLRGHLLLHRVEQDEIGLLQRQSRRNGDNGKGIF